MAKSATEGLSSLTTDPNVVVYVDFCFRMAGFTKWYIATKGFV